VVLFAHIQLVCDVSCDNVPGSSLFVHMGESLGMRLQLGHDLPVIGNRTIFSICYAVIFLRVRACISTVRHMEVTNSTFMEQLS